MSLNQPIKREIIEYFKSPQLALQKSLYVHHIANITSCHSNLIYGKNQESNILICCDIQLGQTPFIRSIFLSLGNWSSISCLLSLVRMYFISSSLLSLIQNGREKKNIFQSISFHFSNCFIYILTNSYIFCLYCFSK